MAAYIISRLIRWVAGLFLVLFITYALMYFGGGDPIRRMFLDMNIDTLTPQAMKAINARYGLDKPFHEQFISYLDRLLLHGDMGNSLRDHRAVSDIIRNRLPISMQLGAAAMLVAALVGVPLGVTAALYHNRWPDTLISGVLALLRAVPVFVFGPVLLLVLVVGLDVMSVPYGWNGIFDTQVILPVLVIAIGPIPVIMRQTRASVLHILNEDYIRTARAKGLPPRTLIVHHIARPALAPVITTLGLTTATVINGAVFVELVFNIPGLGNLSLQGIKTVDYPIILGTVLAGAVLVMICNLLVDLMYPVLDPRVKR
jgi:ABC-type dipeptide/oligopeptide/nickel transport system permease component